MKHKTKITILVATLIVSVALLNVGFAAWVFSNQAEKTYEASVSTEMVTDRSCILEDVSDEYFGKDRAPLHFGVPQNKNIEDAWLDSWEETKVENLAYKIALNVSKNTSTIAISFNAFRGNDNITNQDFKDAVDHDLIAKPVCIVSDEKDGETSDYFSVQTSDDFSFVLVRNKEHDYTSDPRATVVIFVTMKFDWGSHFDGKNPYFYYNEMERDDNIENAYTFEGQELNNNITVNMAAGQTAEAHVDAFASLHKLDEYINGKDKSSGGWSYHYTFVGTAVED